MKIKGISHVNYLYTFGLIASGLLLNIVVSTIITKVGIPLYLDCIGTILVASLAGALPGMIVGFVSNIALTASNSMAAFYGILNVAIAVAATFLSKKGAFKNLKGAFIAFLTFFLIGGVVGSIITVVLYGFTGINVTVGSLYMRVFEYLGINHNIALLFSEWLIDIADKLIVTSLVCFALQHYPASLSGKFAYSWLYDRQGSEESRHFHYSVSQKLGALVGACVIMMGSLTVLLSVFFMQQQVLSADSMTAQAIADNLSSNIDGDLIEDQLKLGESSEGYMETKKNLKKVHDNAPSEVSNIYVFTIRKDEIFSVFNLDTSENIVLPAGTKITDKTDVINRIDQFLAGGRVEPGRDNLSYNTAICAYSPVYDSLGNTVAYTCVDYSVGSFSSQLTKLIGTEINITLAVALLLMMVAVFITNKSFVIPIRNIVRNTESLSEVNPENWLDSKEWAEQVPVETDDELEELYNSVTSANRLVSENVKKALKNESANLAKTQFLARMSHDMRTPLNGILGLTYIMEEEDSVEEMKAELIKMRDSGKYLLQLVNDALDVNKIEIGEMVLHPDVCDEKKLFDSIISMVKPKFDEKSIEFNFETINVEWTNLILDEQRVKQIFVNLLHNAAKFTPTGGKVDFVMELVSEDEQMVQNKFTVRDNGIGMHEDFLSHIFEPFTQENRELEDYGGTGLGLSIVNSLVKLMNGTITATSVLNKGTEFTVFLSFPSVKNEKTEYVPTPKHHQIPPGLRILICEDHPLNGEIAKRLLEKENEVVTLVKNGQLGVEKFSDSEEYSFDLILMDIQMPVMNGLEAAKAIRSLNRKDAATVPIIAMTANVYDEDKRAAEYASIGAHLSKPYTPDQLYAIIVQCLPSKTFNS